MGDIPNHLLCIDCGLGRPIGGGLHTAAECRDNLRANLASERARADRAEKEIDGLRAELDSATIRGRELVEEAEERADRAEAELRRVYLAVRNQDASTQPADMRDLSRIVIDEVGELRRWVDEAEAALATARSEALREAAGVCEAYARENGWSDGQASPGTRRTQSARHGAAMQCRDRILALIGASESGPPRVAETLLTCRTCGASTKGWSDGRFAATGWRRLDHIDGPNAICLTCAADPTALDCLRDEYPRVALASESGEGGADGLP